MGTLKTWGPATWLLFHTLIECIKDEHYDEVYPQLFDYIKQICTLLPCPVCSKHAITYLKKINVQDLKSREQFRMMMFHFHNNVNMNKKLVMFKEDQLDMYKHQRLYQVLDYFFLQYQTKRDMSQLNESFRRKLLVNHLIQWFQNNASKFIFL